jgi:N-acetylneuraminic acid mutarotase
LYGGKLYLFGGSGAAGAVPADNHVYRFDFANGQWS